MNMKTLKSFLFGTLMVTMTVFGTPLAAGTTGAPDATINAASCGTFLRNFATKSVENSEDHPWLAGYVSAYNYLKSITFQILGHSNLLSAELWVKSYCEKNPLKDISDATAALMVELYPTQAIKVKN